MKILLNVFCFVILIANPVKGETFERKNYKIMASQSIKNLDGALQTAKKTLGFPVLFPTFIPDHREYMFPRPDEADQKNTPYYAHTQVVKPTEFIIISIGLNEACLGSKHCTIASLHIKKGGSPEMRTDMSEKAITEVVKLKDDINGYYTPGHPMADFWPPSLQWVYKDTLYDLWWSGVRMDDEETMAASIQQELIKMANSAILEASHQKVRRK